MGAQDGGVKEAAGGGRDSPGVGWGGVGPGTGRFLDPLPALGKGVKPHLQMGLMGSYEVSAHRDSDSLWAQGDHRPLLARLWGFPEVEGLGP